MILAKPRDLFIFAVAPFLGLAAAVFAARVTKGEARVAWLIIAAFAGVGLATSLWQVRAISSASAVALFGGVFVAARAMDWAHRQESILAKPLPVFVILPFCSAFWAIIALAGDKTPANVGKASEDCRSPASIQSLAALPKSVLMEPIDMGSDILADTEHSVLAAPYHRNNHGNGEFVRAMLAKPDDARKIVEGSGATYLVFCRAMPEYDTYIAGSGDGLAATLRDGRVPDWLSPALIAPPLAVYKIR